MPESVLIQQAQLGLNKKLLVDETETITINFQNIPRSNWPELPGDNEFILLNDQYSSFSKFKKW